jgi:hypothetical protein
MQVVRKLNATKENEPSPARKLRQNLQKAIRNITRFSATSFLGGQTRYDNYDNYDQITEL